MATSLMLQLNPKLNPPLLHPLNQPRFSPIKPIVVAVPPTNCLRETSTSNAAVKCEQKNVNLLEMVANAVMKAAKAMQKPAMAAVLAGLLLTWHPNPSALAASGGRVGGSLFAPSSSSSTTTTIDYSVQSSSPRSFAPSSSSTTTTATDYYSFTENKSFSSCSDDDLRYFNSLRAKALAAPAPAPVAVAAPAAPAPALTLTEMFVLCIIMVLAMELYLALNAIKETSVLKLQVGLLGTGRSLQRDLNRIAEVANTSTKEDLHYILTETTVALLRHPDYCISCYSSVDVKQSIEEVEKRFNNLSIEERRKFDEETLVNVNNVKRQSTTNKRANGFSNEYIVITILVAAKGVHKLPTINSSGDLKEALQKLASIPSRNTLAVEVLWTPQNENDTLSQREFLEDYPLLQPL